MFVVKRNGEKQPVMFDKITTRIKTLAKNLPNVNSVMVAQKVVQGVYDGVTTSELDGLAAETSAYLITTHPDYGSLAARLAISNLQKETKTSFMETMRDLHD